MAWFVLCNHYARTAEMPKPLYVFCGGLQRVFFYCLPRSKEDNKTDKNKDVIVEDGEFKKSGDKESTNATSAQKTKFVCCQKPCAPGLRIHIKVESIDNKQHMEVWK